ncbi:putative entry exclusion protein TrbK-alt [Rhodobacteraceae bacterium 2376]|uniref:Putative entry exclusion protein TrbK-alt n=1 Tax=Rhabdonatronobacter sediminivivens TaxID=2743469 RepID=A0A7Z0KZL5_9RHOB|nr:putative entry exclusion protein TrbK-alt [Rhabdonatronobacter sediminivivens]NYS26842.1 putative entry exclusion protein TrbK-alt [Rhabdonatronobacter sediminivivens]
MDGRSTASIAAIILAAAALTAAAVQMTRGERGAPTSTGPALAPAGDPLRTEQRRCQAMGEAAARDPGCLAVWAETRERFLGRPPTPTGD